MRGPVVVSASRGDITLQAFGEIVGILAGIPAGFNTYTLTLGPTGDAHLSCPAGELDAHVALPSQPLHAVMYGRATNPGSTPGTLPARIASLEVRQSGCDAPLALTRQRDPVVLIDDTGAALLGGRTAPSVATTGADVLLAFAAPSMGGASLAIFIAAKQADGTFHVENTGGVVQPVLAPAPGDSLTDPALRDDGA